MSDEAESTVDMAISWRPSPTIFSEVVLGHASAGGVSRIVMGEVAFNEEPGALIPKYQPVFTLAIPQSAIPMLIEALQNILHERRDDEQAAEG